MKCHECMKDFEPRSGNILMEDPWIGAYMVYDIDYQECPQCKEHLYTLETSRKIDAARREREAWLIARLPIGEFISIREAVAILGITKQAFHKNHRIKRGYIYAKKMGGRWFYNKKSVELFRDTGDGRFILDETSKVPTTAIYFFEKNLTIEVKKPENDLNQLPDISNFIYEKSNNISYH